MSSTLVIFARLPRIGQVKTRLEPLLGQEGCLALHYHLIRHALELASEWHAGVVQLWFSDRPSLAELEADIFEPLEISENVTLHYQQGANLGLRMQHALQSVLERGDSVVLIGTDCPEQSPGHLNHSLKLLNSGLDLVLQPAHDGGFVLIACKSKVPDLSGKIDWGSSRVLVQLEAELQKQQLSLGKIETISDLDDEKDFLLLQQDNSLFLSKFYI